MTMMISVDDDPAAARKATRKTTARKTAAPTVRKRADREPAQPRKTTTPRRDGAITATDARKALFRLIAEVNDDSTTVEIVSKHGNAVLMSKAEYNSWKETEYLMSTPANARWLLDSIDQANRGEVEEHELIR